MAAQERPAWASALRQLRQRHSLSQEDLAAMVHVDRTTVSRWETGRNRPQPQQLRRICGEFAVSLRDLCFVESDPENEMERRQVVKGMVGFGLVGAVGSPALEGSSELSPVVAADRLTAAERSVLGEMIGRNIESAWALFHVTDTQRMMAVGRTQLYMLKQHRTQLDPSTMPAFYSAAYRLLGATYHRRRLLPYSHTAYWMSHRTLAFCQSCWRSVSPALWSSDLITGRMLSQPPTISLPRQATVV